jgi:hypothetical protein
MTVVELARVLCQQRNTVDQAVRRLNRAYWLMPHSVADEHRPGRKATRWRAT